MKLDERYLKQVFPESWKTAETFGSLEDTILAFKKKVRAEDVALGTSTVNPMEEFTRIMGLKSPTNARNYIPTDIPTDTTGNSTDISLNVNRTLSVYETKS